jgi:Asp-tRNA(Asn)/Glu-tRNA(Gln) amidotransferase A subunit family amidase
MGRTVADTTLLHGVMAGSDFRDPLSWPAPDQPAWALEPLELGGLRVAISEDLGFAPLDDAIRETFRDAVAQLRGLFAQADERDPPLDDSAHEVFETTRAVSFLAAHGDTYRSRSRDLGPNLRANVAQGLVMSLGDVARAMRRQTELYQAFLGFMDDYDALLCPAMAVTPFPHGQRYVETINGQRLRTYFHWLALAYGLTITAHPVACIPCGRDHAGMPFGIQVCGRRFGDRRTLAVAAALETYLQTVPELARPLPDLARLGARPTGRAIPPAAMAEPAPAAGHATPQGELDVEVAEPGAAAAEPDAGAVSEAESTPRPPRRKRRARRR